MSETVMTVVGILGAVVVFLFLASIIAYGLWWRRCSFVYYVGVELWDNNGQPYSKTRARPCSSKAREVSGGRCALAHTSSG